MSKLGRQRWSYNYRLEQIVSAYRASRSSFESDIKTISKDFEQNRESASENPYADQYEDHLIDLHTEAGEALRLVREAFALVLHHYWERSVMGWLKKSHYDFKKDAETLKSAGYIVGSDLDRLRLVANTIKHNSEKLYEKYPDMFDKSIERWLEDKIEPTYHNFLQLSDEDMNAFVKALETSGPDAKPELSL